MSFLKKEFMGIFKTYKVWVVIAIFLFFAFMSPPVAKFAPEIVESLLESQGTAISIPTPTILDSFTQYFKNLSQIGILAVILLSMGLVAEERAKGTLQLVITKPISRANVVLSKFLAHASLFIVSMIIGAIICYFYSIVIFEAEKLTEFIQANFLFIIYYLVVLSITLFFSTILSNQIAAGGLSIVALASLSILPSLNKTLAKCSPAALISTANNILYKKASFLDATWPIIVSVILIISLLVLGIFIFNKQEI